MTHHDNPELLNHLLQLLTEHGHDGFAEGLRLLVNEAMRLERHHVLQAQPYERTDARKGYANGYKPKTLTSRLGPITFTIPQVRGQTPLIPAHFTEKHLRDLAFWTLVRSEIPVMSLRQTFHLA
jgi:transposase-like protein